MDKYFYIICISFSYLMVGFAELIDKKNDPSNMTGAKNNLIFIENDLPIKGKSNHPVWNPPWFPLSSNGTANFLVNYDKITNKQRLAEYWEIRNGAIKNPCNWEGHCNGAASAAIVFHQPKRSVEYKGRKFSRQEIVALLVELWQGGGGPVVGSRCNYYSPHYDKYNRFTSRKCRDINPASLHILLANYLGIFKIPIIVNDTIGPEVWNTPLIRYEVLKKENVTDLIANDILGVKFRRYKYNPKSRFYTYFHTLVEYSTGEIRILKYILEKAKNDTIIGGEWVGNSKQDHIGFAWRYFKPNPDNPYIIPDIVYEIYNLSLKR